MSKVVLEPTHFLLDIETSGLSRSKDWIICIGVLYLDQGGALSLKQWHLQKPDEEYELLTDFLNFCIDYKRVYTYNGKSFDWPFLISRLAFHNLSSAPLHQLILVDMKKPLSLLSGKRSELEHQFGYERKTTLIGRELVRLYTLYESSGLETYKTLILKHNADELHSLLHFYEIYTLLYHLGSYKCIEAFCSENILTLQLDLPFVLESGFSFTVQDVLFTLQRDSQTLYLKVPLHPLTLKHYLEPLKDYYYIPSENQLMHKSLATFMPKTLKRRATKAECSLTKDSVYLKLFTTYRVSEPLWYDEEGHPFCEYNDLNTATDLVFKQLFYLFFQNEK